LGGEVATAIQRKQCKRERVRFNSRARAEKKKEKEVLSQDPRSLNAEGGEKLEAWPGGKA